MPKFHYTVSAEFHLTTDTAQLIHSTAMGHYDATCRAAASVGGFIYGWTVRLATANDKSRPFKAGVIVLVDFYQADLICKIMEREPEPRVTHDRFYDLLMDIKNETERVNR